MTDIVFRVTIAEDIFYVLSPDSLDAAQLAMKYQQPKAKQGTVFHVNPAKDLEYCVQFSVASTDPRFGKSYSLQKLADAARSILSSVGEKNAPFCRILWSSNL